MCFINVVAKGVKSHKAGPKNIFFILGARSDFLTVLVPLEIYCGVGQVHHQADLPAFIHLIRRVQFLCESCNKKKKKKEWTFLIKLIKPRKCSFATQTLPSLFFSSFGIFFILRSRPLRSVMPYMKAIFSYSSGRAFFRISHTSTSGVSSCCLCSLVMPHPRENCESTIHWRVFATCPEEPIGDRQKKTFLLALVRLAYLL